MKATIGHTDEVSIVKKTLRFALMPFPMKKNVPWLTATCAYNA